MYTIQFWNAFLRQRPKARDKTLFTADLPDAVSIPTANRTNDSLSSQEKYEYLAEYGTHILCLLSRDSGCSYLSPNFKTITGFPAEDYYGHSVLGLLHSDFHDEFEQLLSRPIPENDPVQWRCKFQHCDQKWYWYSVMLHSRHDGKSGEYVCIMENIHDMIQTQNILQKARLEAELALRSRSEFLSNMSHDLRTPLNAIIGFSQVIESEILGKIDNPQYRDYIRHIHESGYDLLAKIEDLLEIANIDAGRVTLTKEDVDMSGIFRHVVDTQTHHAHSAQVAIEVELPEEDILLHVDRLKLQHILGHLVANAIKFSPQGNVVTMEASVTAKGLQICIHDTGTGMTSSKLDAIALALQEDNCWTVAGDSQSIGLGLALTREFVVLHGGEVRVFSKPARGTTIAIQLPHECLRQVGRTPEKADEFAA